MTSKVILVLMAAAGLAMAQNPKPAPVLTPDEAELRAEALAIQAEEMAAESQLSYSLSDAQKKLIAERDQLAASAEGARKRLDKFCAAAAKALDAKTLKCVVAEGGAKK